MHGKGGNVCVGINHVRYRKHELAKFIWCINDNTCKILFRMVYIVVVFMITQAVTSFQTNFLCNLR